MWRDERKMIIRKVREKKVNEEYTDKKENRIFVIYKEIQKGPVAKSDMTSGLLIQYMVKYLCIFSYIRKPFLIYDFATALS